MELHLVAFADANEAAGNLTAESPEDIFHTVGQSFRHFANFEVNNYPGGEGAGDGWRNVWRLGQHGHLFPGDRRIDRFGGWSFEIRLGSEQGATECDCGENNGRFHRGEFRKYSRTK